MGELDDEAEKARLAIMAELAAAEVRVFAADKEFGPRIDEPRIGGIRYLPLQGGADDKEITGRLDEARIDMDGRLGTGIGSRYARIALIATLYGCIPERTKDPDVIRMNRNRGGKFFIWLKDSDITILTELREYS